MPLDSLFLTPNYNLQRDIRMRLKTYMIDMWKKIEKVNHLGKSRTKGSVLH